MATLARPVRDRVGGAFLTRAGGYFTMDSMLFQVVEVPQDSNERCVLVENAESPPEWGPVEMERQVIVKCGRVVVWPPGL